MKYKIAGALVLIGFLIMAGGAGTSDYFCEIGEYYPISETIKTCVAGLLLMLPGAYILKDYREDDEY